MKKIILINTLICSFGLITAQVVKTGKDESSIFAKTTNIGFDLGESELSFSLNNYSRSIAHKNGLLYGVSARGQNSDGAVALFNQGDISPQSFIGGVIGVFGSNSEKKFANIKASSSLTLSAKITKAIETKADQISKSGRMSAPDQKKFANLVSTALTVKVNTFKELLNTLETEYAVIGNSKHYQASLEALSQFIENNPDYQLSNKIQNDITSSTDSILMILESKSYQKHLFYFHGGLNSQQFTLFKGWDTSQLSNSFEDITFNGGQGGFGYNYRIGGHWLAGLKYTYQESNNFSTLGTAKYNYANVKTLKTETYSTKDDIVAKTGNYSKVFLNQLNIDVSYYGKMDPGSYIILDLYYKGTLSNNDSLYASRSNVGIAASYYKQNSKFIGGIYLELPDADQNVENHKPNPHHRPWPYRLSFGIYGKINLNKLLDIKHIF